MKDDASGSSTNRVKRVGATGIAIGVLSIVTCELPTVLAVLGLGGLSSVASVFSLPPMIEIIGITLGLLGLSLLVGLLIYRMVFKVRL